MQEYKDSGKQQEWEAKQAPQKSPRSPPEKKEKATKASKAPAKSAVKLVHGRVPTKPEMRAWLNQYFSAVCLFYFIHCTCFFPPSLCTSLLPTSARTLVEFN